MVSGDSSTILIVSDKNPDAELNIAFLRQPNIRVLTSPQRVRAVGIARREQPQLIIEDLHEPHEKGIALCRELKTDAHTAQIPLILVADAGVKSAAAAADPDMLLCKPLVPRLFFEAVRKFVPLPSRRHNRQKLNLRFSYPIEGRWVQAFSRDMSTAGAFLKTDRLAPLGAHLQMEFHLPGQSRGIRCGAIVRAAVPANCDIRNTGLGIEFEGINDVDLERLDTFLNRHQRRWSPLRWILSHF